MGSWTVIAVLYMEISRVDLESVAKASLIQLMSNKTYSYLIDLVVAWIHKKLGW